MIISINGGRVMAISQILYSQYHVWDLYVLGLKSKDFCKNNNNQILKTIDKGHTVHTLSKKNLLSHLYWGTQWTMEIS